MSGNADNGRFWHSRPHRRLPYTGYIVVISSGDSIFQVDGSHNGINSRVKYIAFVMISLPSKNYASCTQNRECFCHERFTHIEADPWWPIGYMNSHNNLWETSVFCSSAVVLSCRTYTIVTTCVNPGHLHIRSWLLHINCRWNLVVMSLTPWSLWTVVAMTPMSHCLATKRRNLNFLFMQS